MIIIGVDFHPEFQQIFSVDTDSGEFQEKRLVHREDAETFYRAMAGARWFERIVAEFKFELRIGDAAEIRTKRVRKQKTDRQDAQLILRLLLEDRFPQIWVPSWESRDLRQLLWHRHRMVQVRTRIMNQPWRSTKDCAAGSGCGANAEAGTRANKRPSWNPNQ
jgi:transposase